MANIRKFTFDLRFDDDGEGFREPNPSPGDAFYADTPIATPPPAPEPDPEPEPEPEPEGPQLIYTEEDMEIAREEAYVAGHMRALEEAQTAAQQATANALAQVQTGLSSLGPLLDQSNEQIADLAAHVATELCRKLLPHTSEQYAVEEITKLVRALMPSLAGQPRLLIKVHPSLVGPVRSPLEKVAERSGFEGKLVVVDDEAMGLSDARVEWPDGGAERNTSRLWEEIDDLLERNIPRFSRDEALILPGDPKAQDENPWDDLDGDAYWTPPSFHDDFAPSADGDAGFHPDAQHDDGQESQYDAPPERAPAAAPPDDALPQPDDAQDDLGLGDEDIDPFSLLGGDQDDDEDDFDLDGLGLTAEQEAELAALDAELADAQQAAIDEEKE